MTDPDHIKLALEHGDAMVANLLLADLNLEADDVRKVLVEIREDMESAREDLA